MVQITGFAVYIWFSFWVPTSYSCALLSCLSCLQLFATLWTAVRQAPLSMGFSRQEYWNIYIYLYIKKIYIYIYPFHSKTLRLFPYFYYCEQCCNVHKDASEYLFEIVILFLSCIYSKVGLLDHIIVSFSLFFWRTSVLFSRRAVPIFIPTNRVHSLLLYLSFWIIPILTYPGRICFISYQISQINTKIERYHVFMD